MIYAYWAVEVFTFFMGRRHRKRALAYALTYLAPPVEETDVKVEGDLNDWVGDLEDDDEMTNEDWEDWLADFEEANNIQNEDT